MGGGSSPSISSAGSSSPLRLRFDILASNSVSRSSGEVAGVLLVGVSEMEAIRDVELFTLLTPLFVLAVSDRGTSGGGICEIDDAAAASER